MDLDFSDWTTRDWTNAIALIVIPVVVGLIAFAAVLWADWLRRRDERRSERDRRLLVAMTDFRRQAAEINLPGSNDDGVSELLFGPSMTFEWAVIRKRDAPVSEWFSLRSLELVRVRQSDWRPIIKGMHATSVLIEVMNAVNDWRLGVKKPKWFAVQLPALNAASNKPLEPRGKLTVSGSAEVKKAQEPEPE